MSEATEKEVIYLQQSYVNSKGMIIHALIPEAGENTEPEPPKYMAMGQHYVGLAGQPQPVPIQFQFQIPAATIREAFANCPAAFEQAKKEAEVRARSDHRKRQLANLVQ